MTKRCVFLVPAICLAAAGCSTAWFGPSTSPVQMLSEPTGALARTSNGHSCLTPCTIQVTRGEAFSVVFTKDGFQEQTVDVRPRSDSGFSLSGMFGGSGDVSDFMPNPVVATLTALPPPRAVKRRGRRVKRR